jgi:DNA-directed RNA polymerase II subunit RPB1
MKLRKTDPDNSIINNLNTLKVYVKTMRDKIIIKGISNINSVSMFKNQNNFEYKNKSFVQKDEWVLDTNGVNLLEVLMHPNIDSTRTISNDIYEVYDILGIEAAKKVLLSEINQVIDGAGSYVNYRHLSLLLDTMTNQGYLMSIDRFGINRGNIGPLAKCSFEETTDQLFKASIFGEVDKLQGVSANIMMGQIPPCGTGDSDILLDESKLINVSPDDEVELDDIDEWGEMDFCDINVNIDFDVDTIDAQKININEMVSLDIGNVEE